MLKVTGRTVEYKYGNVRLVAHAGAEGGNPFCFTIYSRASVEDPSIVSDYGEETQVVIPADAMRNIVDLLNGTQPAT